MSERNTTASGSTKQPVSTDKQPALLARHKKTTDEPVPEKPGKSAKKTEGEEGEDASRNDRLEVLRRLSQRLRSNQQGYRASKDETWDTIVRTRNRHLLAFSLIGLAASIFLSYYKWFMRCYVLEEDGVCKLEYVNHPNATVHIATYHNTQDMNVTFFFIVAGQVVLTFSTVVCFVVIAQLYGLHLMDRRRMWSGLTEMDLIADDGNTRDKLRLFRRSYSFWQSSLRWQFLIEMVIHAVHPFVLLEPLGPFWQTYYELSECFIFLRLYLLVRALYQSSSIYQFRDDIVASNKSLERVGYQINLTSTAKIIFYKYPSVVMLATTGLAIGVFGFWMFVIERDDNSAFEELSDCIWFVWVSLSTIGYGDMTAVTLTGRSIVILIAFCSLFITTVLAGIVTNLMSATREQKYVSAYTEQKKTELEYKKAAIHMMVSAYRERKLRAKAAAIDEPGIANRRSPETYAAIKRFRQARLNARNALGSAGDPVMDNKLRTAIFQAHQLNKMLDDQAHQTVALEHLMLKSVALIKHRAKHH